MLILILLIMRVEATNFTLHDYLTNQTLHQREFILPLIDQGLVLEFTEPDMVVIDHEITTQVTFEILSPISSYLHNLAQLPFSRFCGITEKEEQKYLHMHIESIKNYWFEQIDGYTDYITNTYRHNRSVINMGVMMILGIYHISKFIKKSREGTEFNHHLAELSDKLVQLATGTNNLLLQTTEILHVVQDYFCATADTFKQLKETTAKLMVHNYVSKVHSTLQRAINNLLPSDPEANQYLTNVCEDLNDHHKHLCPYVTMRGLKSIFKGFTTAEDAFGSVKIIIHMAVSFPIFSSNQFSSKISIGNIGYYNQSDRISLSLPRTAYLFKRNDTVFDTFTPVSNNCDDYFCPPVISALDLEDEICLKGILTTSNDLTETYCKILPMKNICSGIYVGNHEFLVNGNGLYKAQSNSNPIQIRTPTLVPPGTFTCQGKLIKFRAPEGAKGISILSHDSYFINASRHSEQSEYQKIHAKVITISKNLNETIISHQNYTSDVSNLQSGFNHLAHGVSARFIIGLSVSLISILFTIGCATPTFLNLIKRLKSNKMIPPTPQPARIVRFDELESYPFDPKSLPKKSKSTPHL